MTFNALETSARKGRKVFLYTWARGEKVWRYTGADQNLTINFQLFIASAISHENIEQGPNMARISLDVQTPMLHPIALMYREQAPVDSVVLTISEYHQGDPDFETRPIWSGRIVGVKWEPHKAIATITHSPTYKSLERMGLRRRCQATCPLVLYGAGCGVNREAFRLATVASVVDGLNVTAPGISDQVDGYWNGGYIEYTIETGVFERRGITKHTSGTITLESRPVKLDPGDAFRAFPGCDHTTGSNGCQKFSNLPNYGGFNNFPKKNPFGSDPVY